MSICIYRNLIHVIVVLWVKLMLWVSQQYYSVLHSFLCSLFMLPYFLTISTFMAFSAIQTLYKPYLIILTIPRIVRLHCHITWQTVYLWPLLEIFFVLSNYVSCFQTNIIERNIYVTTLFNPIITFVNDQ